ncbi:MAG: DNA mismatch repair endonuclease MutL [Thomasclavelia sp.]|jgi:DNA mismatch repair protein MutL|nr:DNA mismatch repair endonuclease MutL [Thomasclavelia sp.]
MAKIRQLDDALSNKIAAGEVIERPANVIKELVENSIDANANRISILVEEGGLKTIKVTDNGDGMSRDDAKLCFSRHATSKLANDSDLFCITTLGFRGEAIPSIASISNMELKTFDGNESSVINYKYGKLESVKDGDGVQGTSITVSRLFQNVPARLKYVKSMNREFVYIQSYVEQLALSYPNIAFVLVHNDKTTFKSNGNGNLLEVVSNIYGLSVAKNMIEVDFGDDEYHITGYIGKIDISRASKNHITTMVNHRVVKNNISIDAINRAYRPYLADKRYPIALVNIEIDPYLVDVNVHPSKREVKFSKEDKLRELMYQGISKALQGVNLTFKAENDKTFKLDDTQMELDIDYTNTKPVINEIKENKTSYVVSENTSPTINEPVEENKDIETKEEIKPIKQKLFAVGQVHGSYIIAEDEKGMYLIDQHAAQERVNYEYFLNKYSNLDLSFKDLLVPLTLEYPLSEIMKIEDKKDILKEIGINIESFGNGFIIRQLPVWMNNIDEKVFIDEIMEQVLNDKSIDVMGLRDHAIATLACKASLKANSHLSLIAIQEILDNLMRCDNPYVCPHGRPTIISYSNYDLEKMFKRVN